eukprot:7380766-Prymnesium_polylepis.1
MSRSVSLMPTQIDISSPAPSRKVPSSMAAMVVPVSAAAPILCVRAYSKPAIWPSELRTKETLRRGCARGAGLSDAPNAPS